MIDVSILIVNFQTAQSVLATVDSIYQWTHNVSFEIIVADNASDESNLQLLRNDNRFRLIELPQNIGFGRANNAAAQIANGQYLFCLNPDTILINPAIEILISYLNTHPSVGIAGGNLYNLQNLPTHSYHRLLPGIFSELDFTYHQLFRRILFGKNAQFNHSNHPLKVAMITGADLMIRHSIFKELNGFDPSFFMYNEDADLCLRTQQMGFSIMNIPSAHIQHLEGQSLQDKSKRTHLTLQGRNTYFRKHFSPRYCEWANRLFRFTNSLAGHLCSLVGQHNLSQLYLLRAHICKVQAPLLINGRFLLRKPTGVEQYAINMTRTLLDMGISVEIICPVFGTISPQYDLSNIRLIRRGLSCGHIWEQCFLPLYRLFHHEGHFITFCGLGSILCRNEIMTIHDLSFIENPQWFSRLYALTYRILTPLAARTAKAVLTVSSHSAKQIESTYPFTKHKLHIIPCATPRIFESIEHTASPSKNYFLSVASMDPRKNIASLLQVMQMHPEWHLKLVGTTHSVFASCSHLSIPDNVELLGYVDTPDLVKLYAEATAFIFPSLYEGFGIPPLEAMSVGCPVLCSDIPVLHTVLEDAPMYFIPSDITDITQCIVNFLALTASQRQQMINSGYQQAKKYSWQTSAKQLIELLASI